MIINILDLPVNINNGGRHAALCKELNKGRNTIMGLFLVPTEKYIMWTFMNTYTLNGDAGNTIRFKQYFIMNVDQIYHVCRMYSDLLTGSRRDFVIEGELFEKTEAGWETEPATLTIAAQHGYVSRLQFSLASVAMPDIITDFVTDRGPTAWACTKLKSIATYIAGQRAKKSAGSETTSVVLRP